MKNIRMILFFLTLVVTGLSCSKSNRITNGTFIEKEGRYNLLNDSAFEIFQDDNGKLNIRHYKSNGNMLQSKQGFIELNSGWFVYIEKHNRIWLSTDNNIELYFEGKKESGCESLYGCDNSGELNESVYSKIPQKVLNKRLKPITMNGNGKPGQRETGPGINAQVKVTHSKERGQSDER